MVEMEKENIQTVINGKGNASVIVRAERVRMLLPTSPNLSSNGLMPISDQRLKQFFRATIRSLVCKVALVLARQRRSPS